MLASRQLLGVARGRAAAGLRRGMATATENPLDRKVSPFRCFIERSA